MYFNRTMPHTFTLLAAFLVATGAILSVADADGPSAQEQELLVVLRSDAPAAEKAITCKLLAIHGSSAAVPDLAQLLPDAQLASWARIALEAIPGPEADAALRTALDSLEGNLRVGTINSIGVRRDAEAVESLVLQLQGDDADAASAAAVALGRIGNADATEALRQSLATASSEVRSAVAEGCILCAERQLAEGSANEAATIYDEVRHAEVPEPRIIEATRGAILARGDEGIPLLLEQFQSPDKGRFQLALSTAREFPGNQVDRALAEEVSRAVPERAALLIEAMADREETVVLSAILQAAEQGPKPIRLAAINALGRVGDASCLSALLESGIDEDGELAAVAKSTLANLPQDVDSQIVTLLADAKGPMYPLLIELVGQRRIEATPALLDALKHSDSDIRQAALVALGETIKPDRLSVLISQVIDPQDAGDVDVARQALKAASVRMPDREACAAELAAALDQTRSIPTQCALLEVLGAVGGTQALATLGEAAKKSDEDLQDVSTRLLGEWMTADAAPVLLDLAQSAPGGKYRTRALRGYIRIARQFVLPEQERIEMCRQAFAVADQSAEQKLVLDVLKRYPSTETLELAINAMRTSELKDEATQATLVIAQKLGGQGAATKELLANAGFEKLDLEIIQAEYGAGQTQKDVTEVIRRQAGDLPLITLPSASYNASFGGDPLPGQRKQLKIQYRINGKRAEASFAENDLILLPMPK